MSTEPLGPIEIVCDAPAYAVVKACGNLGFRLPPDVRWCRADRRQLQKKPARPPLVPWGRSNVSIKKKCSCGEEMPALESYTFTFTSGKQARYFLGQCPRCSTIYWDQEQSS